MSQPSEPKTDRQNLPETEKILAAIERENRPMTMRESYTMNMEMIRAISNRRT